MNKRTGDPLLQINGLSRAFSNGKDKLQVLQSVSLDACEGEFIAIIGPSGCGKSTFFNILAGLISPDEGNIMLDGKKVPHLRGRMAYMQQKDLLLPWRNTLDNAILGMEIQGRHKRSAREQARELLKIFGLEGFEEHYPQELSGGMRQRVALMRTILCKKDILLLDEPFGALDAMTRGIMQRWLLKVWGQFGPSVLLVTHDVEEALILADRIYVMTSRPGSIKGSLQVSFERPRRITQADMVDCKKYLLELLEEEIMVGQP
ncbi:MAG: ABC transporter ATP-binding protein [Deltaproteobacteria bacterium]|nr:MAG: ABC transporter ATP-binding protein [Deltaproteobacteria bacterium]